MVLNTVGILKFALFVLIGIPVFVVAVVLLVVAIGIAEVML